MFIVANCINLTNELSIEFQKSDPFELWLMFPSLLQTVKHTSLNTTNLHQSYNCRRYLEYCFSENVVNDNYGIGLHSLIFANSSLFTWRFFMIMTNFIIVYFYFKL